MKATSARPRLCVTTGGTEVVSLVGARLLVELADALGLTEFLSGAITSWSMVAGTAAGATSGWHDSFAPQGTTSTHPP